MSLFDSGVRPAVDAWLLEKSKEERDYGNYWSASSAGYCMRKVIFERLGVPKIEQVGDARKQRVFTSGHIFHQWVQEITKESGLSLAQELELQDEELMIRGHIDDLVLVGEGGGKELTWDDAAVLYKERTGGSAKIRPMEAIFEWAESQPDIEKTEDGSLRMKSAQHLILYDYKTVNSRAFMWAKKNGNAMSYYHKMQLGTYMYMLRKPSVIKSWDFSGFKEHDADFESLTEARILKIEKDSLMMGEQQLMWSDELEAEVKKYWTTLNLYWLQKKIPKCTCADYENGFLAKEAYNGYFFNGEPCSLEYYRRWKESKDGQKDS